MRRAAFNLLRLGCKLFSKGFQGRERLIEKGLNMLHQKAYVSIEVVLVSSRRALTAS